MKKFIIEIRVNPFDEFKKYKQYRRTKREINMKEDLIYALRLTTDENTIDLGIKWVLENQVKIKNFLFLL